MESVVVNRDMELSLELGDNQVEAVVSPDMEHSLE